jgi:DNA polymerase-3 subunit beta
MEFVCSKKDLQAGVSIVERIVSTRSTLPIVGNILFEASRGGLKLSANNLEIGIEVNVAAQTIKEGSILIPAKTLGEVVAKLPDSEITFKLKDKGVISINYKKSNINIHGLPADEFPQLPHIKEGKSINLEAKMFAEMIEHTIFASSNSEDKHVLNGILMEIGKQEASNIRMVATDGYRLAKRAEKAAGLDISANVIIPARALNEVLRILQADLEGQVKLVVSSDRIAFKYQEVYLVSRLIQGQFPDYKQVIPKGSDTKVSIDTQAFLSAAERAAIIAQQSANIIKIEVRSGQLKILATAPDVGSVEEVLEVETKGKEKAQVAFNVRLITDVLKVIETEKISLELGETLNPGLIRPVGGPDYIYIVMPIRTQEVSA